MAEIVIVETKALGDRSYVVHDGEVAIVIDPQRDTDRIEAVTEPLGLRIALVLETHIHNDYVTGGFALALATGASYVVAASDEVAFDRLAAGDGDCFDAGRLSVTAVHTPGHTPHHLSYVLREDGKEPIAVFTGGSMLFGAVGRTDLVGEDLADELTRAQYHSVRRLADDLGSEVAVHPTHGFGSFCSATATSGDSSTIGKERQANIALTTDDEDAFVKRLLAGLSAYPRYYAHMGPANAAGPRRPDLSTPKEVDAAELRRRIDAGEWVVDLRERVAFAHHHVAGTVSIELGDMFATYLGWTVPWGAPLTLLADTSGQVADAQRQLSRIGIDHLAGGATGGPDALAQDHVDGYRVANFKELAEAEGDGPAILDVRRPDEWAEGHLVGAQHIPLWELESRMGELPAGEIWVHCASGFRSSVGASLVARSGHRTVLVDDEWTNAADAGLPIESEG